MGELFDKVTNANSLYSAYVLARKNSDWKSSVQKYGMNALLNIFHTQRELRAGEYRQMPFVEFTLHERGKTRRIKSLHIRDRVIQRALCDQVLIPVLTPSLTYDNGASIKGKGITFTRNRFKAHLEKFYRKYGLDGYVLKLDFSKYFDNIDHAKVKALIAEKVDDPLAMRLVSDLIDSFRLDVSALTDNEREKLKTTPVNLLTMPRSEEGAHMLNRSVGIGSQISQVIGIYLPNKIDNFVISTPGVFSHDRYMDDSMTLAHDKGVLLKVLESVRALAKQLGIFINERKTAIIPLRAGFTFLQIRYQIFKGGRIVKKLNPQAFYREQRKLRVYAGMLAAKRLNHRDVATFVQSWYGNAKNFNNHRKLRKTIGVYNKLFLNNFA